MRLSVPLKLQPSDEQRAALRHTLELANAAANAISTLAWRERTFGSIQLHRNGHERAVGTSFEVIRNATSRA